MDEGEANAIVAGVVWHRYQMPAYHLIAADGDGITLVNIGVGPSNAKNITDHWRCCVRSWLMIGHCGGLRQSQTIGDYVLAHAYMRRARHPRPRARRTSRSRRWPRSRSPWEAAAEVTGAARSATTLAHRHRAHLRRPQLEAARRQERH